jgi:hypothetical protein
VEILKKSIKNTVGRASGRQYSREIRGKTLKHILGKASGHRLTTLENGVREGIGRKSEET